MSDGERRQMGGMYGRQHYRREVRWVKVVVVCCVGLLVCLVVWWNACQSVCRQQWHALLVGRCCRRCCCSFSATATATAAVISVQEEDEEDEAPVDDVKKIQGGWLGGWAGGRVGGRAGGCSSSGSGSDGYGGRGASLARSLPRTGLACPHPCSSQNLCAALCWTGPVLSRLWGDLSCSSL
jgi:uncharacterized membrane protein YgcG